MINLFTEEYVKDLVVQAVAKAESFLKDGKYADAEVILKQTLKVDPSCKEAIRLICQIYLSQQKGKEAIPYYEKLLETYPDDYEALNNVALCYSSVGEIDKSIEKLLKCEQLYPNVASCYWNLAVQYKEKGEHSKSFLTYERGIEFLPTDPLIRYNYAIGLAERFLFDEALIQYKKAIQFEPNFSSARFNLGLLNLQLGNYEEGWAGYEWRFQHVPVFQQFKERFADKPEWKGEFLENGEEKTILVYNEQGAGDAIQFVRYLPKIKELGFRVILEVAHELVDLLAQCEGVDQIIPLRPKKMPEYDYHVSICSLPHVLNISKPMWDGVYVKPTGSINLESYKDCKRVGICWAGNPVHRQDKERSCYLKDFKHINDIYDVKLFSLQKDLRSRFWAGQGVVDLTEDCKDMGVVDMSDMLIDFNYTAAIMKCMDFIVTVDSAVAHLAGAMGLPCYLILSHLSEFRWGVNGDNTPWYPSVKLVRQLEPGDYNSRLRQIAYEIKQK